MDALSYCNNYLVSSDVTHLPFELQELIFSFHDLKVQSVQQLRCVNRSWKTMVQKLPVRIFMTAGLETHRDVVPLASAYPYASSVEFLNVKKCMPCDMWHAITSLKYLDTLLLYDCSRLLVRILADAIPKMPRLRYRKFSSFLHIILLPYLAIFLKSLS